MFASAKIVLQFNGSELSPAAGMLVMAIEAARQMKNSYLKIRGYKFVDVRFLKPLLVSLDPGGVEAQFQLRPQKADSHSTTALFHLYTYTKEDWFEACRGSIETYYEQPLATGPASKSTGGRLQRMNTGSQSRPGMKSVSKLDFY